MFEKLLVPQELSPLLQGPCDTVKHVTEGFRLVGFSKSIMALSVNESFLKQLVCLLSLTHFCVSTRLKGRESVSRFIYAEFQSNGQRRRSF